MTTTEAIRLEEGIDRALLAGNLEEAEAWTLRYLDAVPGGPPPGDLARTSWFRARYCAGKVSLANGRLHQTLDRLLPLLVTVERLSPDLAGRVRLLVAEALTRLSRGEDGRVLLQEVPASLLGHDLPSRFRALRIRLWLGEVASLDSSWTIASTPWGRQARRPTTYCCSVRKAEPGMRPAT
jgi:hypothetical protein